MERCSCARQCEYIESRLCTFADRPSISAFFRRISASLRCISASLRCISAFFCCNSSWNRAHVCACVVWHSARLALSALFSQKSWSYATFIASNSHWSLASGGGLGATAPVTPVATACGRGGGQAWGGTCHGAVTPSGTSPGGEPIHPDILDGVVRGRRLLVVRVGRRVRA